MINSNGNTKYNVFSINNPNEVECIVEEHSASHSVLHIKIYNPTSQESQILEFQSVYYFSGPMSWVGANFELLPWRDCVNLLVEVGKLHRLNDMTLDMQREIGEKHFHLYGVNAVNPSMKIRILAGNAQIL